MLLHVDDAEEWHNHVSRILAPSGRHEIITATSLTEARNMVRSDPSINLIILDLNLHPSRPDETLAVLRDLAKEIPVVVCTSAGDEEYVETVLDAGAVGYVAKGEAMIRSLPAAINAALSGTLMQRAMEGTS